VPRETRQDRHCRKKQFVITIEDSKQTPSVIGNSQVISTDILYKIPHFYLSQCTISLTDSSTSLTCKYYQREMSLTKPHGLNPEDLSSVITFPSFSRDLNMTRNSYFLTMLAHIKERKRTVPSFVLDK